MEQLKSHLVLVAGAAIDLQMHTTYSDGSWTPEALVDHLVAEQFGLGAVTDHDRLDSVAAVQLVGAEKGLPLLAAVEMSTSWNGEATDLLCYGFDPGAADELETLGKAVIAKQIEITRENYEELKRRGYQFSREEEILGANRAGPLRYFDIGQLLLQHGYSTGPGSIGKIMTDAGFYFATNDIAEVVDAAHRSGAVCLIAHPGRGGEFTQYDQVLLDRLLADVPVDGLEVYYPAHTEAQIAMYFDYAGKRQLLVSSGSDSHGPEKVPIKYRAELSRRLLERVGVPIE
jgi:predicted metal-dependent phosphoesterase TrpH